ncbi:MAG: HIT family protein [Patescibacteria group bacterium]
MYNHSPEGYSCPFCKVAQGIEDNDVYTKQNDIIYQDSYLTAFVSSHSWPSNPGNVIIIPNQHFENVFDLDDEIGAKIHSLSKRIAISMKKVYRCDGISFRQHNEPAGNQDVWHYHYHVIPRFEGDNLYIKHLQKYLTDSTQRQKYAKSLRTELNN